MDFTPADQSDVPGLAASEVLLQEHALGVVNLVEPRPRIGQAFRKGSCGWDWSANRMGF